MTPRLPNLLDKLAGFIPGYKSFSQKEARRDSDKRLRDHVADTLDANKRHVDSLVLACTDAGSLDGLDLLDRLKRRVGTCADSIRLAEYGESGFTDDVVIDEADLERVHEFDLGLLEQAKQVSSSIQDLTNDNLAEVLAGVTSSVDDLLRAIESRGELLREVF
jgi:hypothetical protein